MLNPEYIDLLCRLIATPSFSREEKNACDILEQWLLAHGLSPQRNGNNLLLFSNAQIGLCPSILLNAHLDTVRPAAGYTRDPFTPTIEGDRVYGLGSNDDLGSLIALLATYIDLTTQTAQRSNSVAVKQRSGLILSLTAEEEVSGTGGIDRILPELGTVDWGIVGEPTQMQMAIAERGLLVLDCTAHGVSGHAARSEGVNALYKAMDDIHWFRTYQFEKVSPYLGAVKMSVTMIDAGTQHNQIPDTCHFVVDIRSNGLYSNQELVDFIRQQVSCEVIPRSTRLNASHIDENHPVVLRAKELGIATFGSPTTSNQTLLPFPTVKIGPGDSARSHTADEYICLSEIAQAMAIYKQLLAPFL